MEKSGLHIHVLLVEESIYAQTKDSNFERLCDESWDIDKRSAEYHIKRMNGFSQYKGFRIVALNTSSEPITRLYELLIADYGLNPAEMKTDVVSIGWERDNDGA